MTRRLQTGDRVSLGDRINGTVIRRTLSLVRVGRDDGTEDWRAEHEVIRIPESDGAA